MKKVFKLLFIILFTFLSVQFFTAQVAYADTQVHDYAHKFKNDTDEELAGQVDLETITKLMSDKKTAQAVQDYLYFDSTTLWMIIAAFGIAIGMINLSAGVASHFVQGAGDKTVGDMTYHGATALAAGTITMATKGGRAAKTVNAQHSEMKKIESERSAGNRTYDMKEVQKPNDQMQLQSSDMNKENPAAQANEQDQASDKGSDKGQDLSETRNEGNNEGGPTNTDGNQKQNADVSSSNANKQEGGPTAPQDSAKQQEGDSAADASDTSGDASDTSGDAGDTSGGS